MGIYIQLRQAPNLQFCRPALLGKITGFMNARLLPGDDTFVSLSVPAELKTAGDGTVTVKKRAAWFYKSQDP